MDAEELKPDEIVAECVENNLSRVVRAVMIAAVAGIIILISTLVILQFALSPDWTPQDRFTVAVSAAIAGAVILGVLLYLQRTYGITILRNEILIYRGRRTYVVPASDVLAAIGVAGVDISGGELLVWKSIVLATNSRTYTLRFGPDVNLQVIGPILGVCEQCVGLPYPPDGVYRPELLDAQQAVLASVLRRSALRKLICGVVLMSPFVAVMAVCIAQDKLQMVAVASGTMAVGVVAATYFLISAVREALLPQKLRRFIPPDC
ncbi:hypothetical protein GC176_07485 [bacterium]|nr:hypothetical protein [bacterium]